MPRFVPFSSQISPIQLEEYSLPMHDFVYFLPLLLFAEHFEMTYMK